VSEFIGRLDLAGSRIVEYPTTLEVRMLGRSKMKVLGTIAGQLGVLRTLVGIRLAGTTASRPEPHPAVPSPVPAPRAHT
jgi:hypothetical protein